MSAVDTFRSPFRFGAENSYRRAEAVTPSDTVDLARVSVQLYVGGTGDVAVITVDGDTATFKAVPVGTLLPVRVKRVKATGTTATLMLALS